MFFGNVGEEFCHSEAHTSILECMETGAKKDDGSSATQSAFADELSERLKSFVSAPILFVGSGMSRRYLGLPNWEGLLTEAAAKTDKSYAYYRSNANGDLPTIAQLLVNPINELIWTDEYKGIRDANELHLQKQDSALKILISERMLQLVPTVDEALQQELELFKNAVIDAVITTNYDTMLEGIFPGYQVYVGQDELLFADPRGVGEIYKIHGSASNPNSIVLTKEDYEVYSKRNPYLAAKLLTLFAEHPVIFLGYSLSDPNVTQLLESLVSCLKPEHVSKLQDRLIFVHCRDSEKSEITSTVIPIQGTNLPVININVPNFREIFSVLGSLKRKFSARMLRRLKDHIYELILTNDPNGRLHVIDFEEDKENAPDVVIGVGAMANLGKYGYRRISRVHLLHDALHDNEQYDPEEIVKETLPEFLSNGNFPLIKYMIAAKFIDADGNVLRGEDMDERLLARYKMGAKPLLPTKSTGRYAKRIALKAGDFKTLIATEEYKHVLIALPALGAKDIDLEDLHKYLLEHENEAVVDGKCETNFAKAVCLYERLKYLKEPW